MENTTARLINSFVSKIKAIQGALIIGSFAYGTERKDSDIDLKLISDNMQETLNSDILRAIDTASGIKDLEARSRQDCDAHSFKGIFEGRLFSPSIYTKQAFQKIIGMERAELEYTRNTPNSGIEIELYDFRRNAIKYMIKNQQLASGHFLAWEPISVESRRTYFTHFGTDPDALLKMPFIFPDNGWISTELRRFWDNVYNLMVDEARKPEKLLKTGKLPIIENQSLPGDVYSYIKYQLNEAKSRKGY